jgi:hypothetical protein
MHIIQLFLDGNWVTRGVCEKVAQNVAQPTFCQNNCISSALGKRSPKVLVTSLIFKIFKSKQ